MCRMGHRSDVAFTDTERWPRVSGRVRAPGKRVHAYARIDVCVVADRRLSRTVRRELRTDCLFAGRSGADGSRSRTATRVHERTKVRVPRRDPSPLHRLYGASHDLPTMGRRQGHGMPVGLRIDVGAARASGREASHQPNREDWRRPPRRDQGLPPRFLNVTAFVASSVRAEWQSPSVSRRWRYRCIAPSDWRTSLEGAGGLAPVLAGSGPDDQAERRSAVDRPAVEEHTLRRPPR